MKHLIFCLFLNICHICFSQNNVVRIPSNKKYFLLDTAHIKCNKFLFDTTGGEAIVFTDTMAIDYKKKLNFYNSKGFYNHGAWNNVDFIGNDMYTEIYDKFKIIADGYLRGHISIEISRYNKKNKFDKYYNEGLCLFILINNNMLIEDLKKQGEINTILKSMSKDVYIPMVIYLSSTDKRFLKTNWEEYHKIKN